jgi:hypothetical protein
MNRPPLRRGARLAVAALASLACSGAAAARADDSNFDLKIYGNVNGTVRNHSTVSNGFSAGQFTLFPTFDADRLKVLAEVQFEANQETNEVGVDLERLQVGYMLSEKLRIKAGRMHTAFGYYNDAYHHGKLFELATDRPLHVNFEDEGGLLQAHIVGLAADGRFKLGPTDLHYDLEVGNGRGNSISEVTIVTARKDAKAVNLRLRLLPNFIDGLVIGANVLYDQVHGAGTTTDESGEPVVKNKLHEIDAGVHLAYMEDGWHLLGEGTFMQHREPATGLVYTTWAGFVEVGKSLSDFTPYVRYEHIALDDKGDPLFQTGKLKDAGTINDFRAGLKWLATPNVALKLEGRTFSSHVAHSQQSITAQAAFGF